MIKFSQTRWPVAFFLLSGFCGLLYQVVWLRLAFHSFGVITPVLSVVVSVFMAGLALGSQFGGRIVNFFCRKFSRNALFYYGMVEALIGIGAIAVPYLFLSSEKFLFTAGELDSNSYLLNSGLMISLCILPWCILMGFTYPFMMAQLEAEGEDHGFSHLYLANVVGAMLGTLLTAYVLIEVFGFTNTLLVAGVINFFIAVMSMYWSTKLPATPIAMEAKQQRRGTFGSIKGAKVILFFTGFSSMALEVVWTRAFTAVLETTVYAFASLVAAYLFATWVGSRIYRNKVKLAQPISVDCLLSALAISSFFPLILNDPRLHTSKLIVLISIMPMSAILGFVTPFLIDQLSEGKPDRAGRMYAINIIGCILGPLFASYLVLPSLGAKFGMLLLSLPFVVVFWIYGNHGVKSSIWLARGISGLVIIVSMFFTLSYEERFLDRDYAKEGVIRRDHTATVISYGKEWNSKHLYVNGVGITVLNTTTKWMAHLPLALLPETPKSTLVICFGMGTTFRSMLKWPTLENVNAVELVPSVKDALGYYHRDADQIIADIRGKIIIDDGRRFLRRSRDKYDVITLDPPPPIQAAGSGMLYSDQFVALMKDHLKEKGILAHWIPYGADPVFYYGALKVIKKHFAYIRYFDGALGTHFIASNFETPRLNSQELLNRLPEAAKLDLPEWEEGKDVNFLSQQMLALEKTEAEILQNKNLNDFKLTSDDFPLNEYYKVRSWKTKFKRILNLASGRDVSYGL